MPHPETSDPPGRFDPAPAIALWRGDPASLRGLRRGENDVYRFAAPATPGGLVLRATSDGHRPRTEIEAELDFIQFVAARGVSAALPVASNGGSLVETIAVGGRVFHVVAFHALPGRHFAYRSADIARPLFAAWGDAMGALHTAARQIQPSSGRRRRVWRQDEAFRIDAELPASEATALREREELGAWLATRPMTTDDFGLIHGDFERTNFLIDGGRINVLDFDDACYNWYLADIAHALWAFRGAARDDRRQFLAWFLDGYGQRALLPHDAGDALSRFVRIRSLALFRRHLRTAEPQDAWTDRMRRDFATPFRW